jgi:hypothetical protein
MRESNWYPVAATIAGLLAIIAILATASPAKANWNRAPDGAVRLPVGEKVWTGPGVSDIECRRNGRMLVQIRTRYGWRFNRAVQWNTRTKRLRAVRPGVSCLIWYG